MHKLFRVIRPYQAAHPDPWTARKGQHLEFERRESEWEDWIWCTDPSGNSAWVPENWVELEGEFCILQRDYTSTELSVDEGEIITAELDESGWVWATRETGERGWVPLEHLTALPYSISAPDQVRMLRRLMLYWDGQWFLKSVETFGLEAAIDLNARVRTSFGRIEMRLLLKTVGKKQADDLADALHLLETYADTFMGKGIRADFAALDTDRAEVTIRRCAAFEGAKRASLARVDQACVACETLWDTWLETLLPDVPVQVEYPARQGMGDPVCRFEIQIGAGSEKQ